jgi:hypothetical protein
MPDNSSGAGGIDRAIREITEVTYRYGRAMDDRDWSTFASLFTQDAKANLADEHFLNGREEITDLVRTVIEACAVTHHTMTNHLVALEGDRGSVELYCRAFHQGSGSKADMTYDCLARYSGKVVYDGDQWRISEWRETISYDWGSQDVFNLDTPSTPGHELLQTETA